MKWFAVFVLVTFLEYNFGLNLTEQFFWPEIKFAFENQENQTQWFETDEFADSEKSNVIRGIGLWKEKLFLSVLRLPDSKQEGTHSALNYVLLNTTERSPTLNPYPSPDNLIKSSCLLDIDSCDRLWLADDSNNQIIIIDLYRNTILRRKRIKTKYHSPLINVIVDVNETDCENAYAYIPDPSTFAITVYRFSDNKYWRIDRPKFTSTNPTFKRQFPGIYTSTLSAADHTNGYRTLYIQPVISDYVLSISTKVLRDLNTIRKASTEFKIVGYKGKRSRSMLVHYDKRSGVLFYDLYEKQSIGCWNSKRFPNELSEKTTGIVRFSPNATYTQFADIKTDELGNFWIGVRNLQYREENLEKNEYFLYNVSVKDLVKDTICE